MDSFNDINPEEYRYIDVEPTTDDAGADDGYQYAADNSGDNAYSDDKFDGEYESGSEGDNYDDDNNYDDTLLDNEMKKWTQQAASYNTPESQTLDTKAYAQNNIRKGGTNFDRLGNGELFNDESSTAALLAVMGFMLVLFVGACVYGSFRQTMNITTPNSKNKMQDTVMTSILSFDKRRE